LHQQLDSSSLLTLVVLGLGTLQINIHVVIMPLALRRRKDGVADRADGGPFAVIAVAHK
jgi:hypothetical protein